MQYSTLRISTLVAIFSASSALAYLDCGGGRAPPKTTVPGCPGYVGPTSVVVSSAVVSPTSAVVSSVVVGPTGSAISEEDKILDQFIESSGVDDGLCVCSGYFCGFARPGCVSIGKDGVRSTITANPGYQTKTFNVAEYSSYTATAGSVMYYSADGEVISSKPTATGHLSISGSSTHSSGYPTTSHTTAGTSGVTSSGVTSTRASSSTITEAPVNMNTTALSTMSTSTVVNATMSANATVSASGSPLTNPSAGGASRASGISGLAILLGFGMGAMAWL